MIIWVNGAFGAGKTQSASELHRRLPNSFVFDPENAGYYIRKNMTIVNPHYYEEIVGRLLNDGFRVDHYTLYASKEVLLRRLKKRGERKGSWPERQIDRCMEGLANPLFQHHIQTDHMSICEVVEKIASMSNLRLEPDKRGAVRRQIDQLITQVRHIRWF
ncbi:AAA family ATPase [Paenibacillus sp. GCM10023252]|uniref:AAA family ATPase n=1 Tax=Paenibacillus sp. GCM10023252 TaxID=3252649 RepID=UPI003616B5A0